MRTSPLPGLVKRMSTTGYKRNSPDVNNKVNERYFAMKKTTNNTTENITKRVDLQNLLGIEKTQVVKENKQLSEKAQLMRDVNSEIHKLLVTKYGNYYKDIATDIVVKQKDCKYNIK